MSTILPNTCKRLGVFALSMFAITFLLSPTFSPTTLAKIRAQEQMTGSETSSTIDTEAGATNTITQNAPAADAAAVEATANTLSFLASPPRLELKGKPGETLQTTVKVKNVTDVEQVYESQVFDFVVGEDGSTPIPVTEKASGRWSAASWMTLTPAESRLKKNATKEIDVIVQIPQNALPGGHYAMITHNPKQPEETVKLGQPAKKPTSSAVIIPRVGTLVYITVAGDIHEEAFVRNFKAPNWVEFGPVPFSFTIENQSDIHIRPQSTITVKNVFGQVKEVIAVDSKNIFPLSNREFEATWDTFWGFGPYTAVLDVSYGTSGKTYATALTFWIIPYRILLSIAVILVTLLVIFISVRRHIIHRNDLKTKQIEVLEEKVRALEEELGQK